MRALAVLVLLLAVGTLAGGARAEDGPETPVLDVPVGIPVQIDGRTTPAEWSDARVLPVGTDGTTLRLKQVRGMLLLAFESPAPWREASVLWLLFQRDDPSVGLYDPGAVRLDYEPLEHDRPHLMVFRRDPAVEVRLDDDAAVARSEVREAGVTIEIGLSLDALGLLPAEAPTPLRFAVLWSRPRARSHPTWPEGLSLEGPLGAPPPDLASSARWGRLGGWVEVDGPGAFPAAEWKALAEASAEIARRGRDAHAFGLLVDEEPQTKKMDVTQVPDVVGNLAWIAEREPLTPKDLMLLVKSYRFWNRTDEALRLLDALEAWPAWRGSDALLYQRALTLRNAERYAEAAATWDRLARASAEPRRAQYQATAARERERLEAWRLEQAARREDAASTTLPIVELITTRGSIFAVLHADEVPDGVEHFLALVDRRDENDPVRGFYDGTFFHRVIGGFLAQVGDPGTKPEEDGGGGCDAGGPGSGPEQVNVETNPRHGFWRGALGFARGPELVNGSQFFLLTGPRPELGEKDFTCFGHVVAGMDVVDRLEMCDALLEIRVLRRPPPSAPGDAEGEDE